MKNKKRLLILIGASIILIIVLAILVFKFVPWHKFIKVPTANEEAFVQQHPLQNQSPHTLSFDFEIDSTKDIPNGIYKGIAHSGNFSAKVFGKNSYSVSVVRTAGEIGLENLDGVAMSAWVYAFPTDNEVNGSLVFSANNSVGVNICWKGVYFSGPMIPKEKWTKVSSYFDLSDVRLRKDDKIQLYFWNNSSTDLLVDDFYFVFGAPGERKGDSAFVDLTHEKGYVPRFNIPPFQPVFLLKQSIGNADNPSLIVDNHVQAGEITPQDRVVAGNFITSRGEAQSMLVIKPDGKLHLFHYCLREEKFIEVAIDCPANLLPVLQGDILLPGRFLSSPLDQLFAAGPNGMALIGFGSTANPCTANGSPVRVNALWETGMHELAGIPLQQAGDAIAGDLTGDRISELLLFDKTGSWKILKFQAATPSSGEWHLQATGEEYRIGEWNSALVAFKPHAARFLSSIDQDLVLTIFRDTKSGRLSYSMLRYLPADKKFVKVYPDRQRSLGLTLGIDTLKLTDQIIPVYSPAHKTPTILRYNRDWRYDLKELQFNDTTFQILAGVDFSGYPEDRNPKYYEILKMHEGRWIDPATSSLLVVGRNCKDAGFNGDGCSEYEELPDLPSTLQLYSFPPKNK